MCVHRHDERPGEKSTGAGEKDQKDFKDHKDLKDGGFVVLVVLDVLCVLSGFPFPGEGLQSRSMELISTHIGADFDAFAAMVAAARLHPGAKMFFPGSREESLRRMLESGLVELSELRRNKNRKHGIDQHDPQIYNTGDVGEEGD